MARSMEKRKNYRVILASMNVNYEPPKPAAVVWKNAVSEAKLAEVKLQAQHYAAREHTIPEVATAFVFAMGEKDPLGKARAKVLDMAQHLGFAPPGPGASAAKHERGKNPRTTYRKPARKPREGDVSPVYPYVTPLPCKLHKGEHSYKVCRGCGKQFCPHYWSECPRCNPAATAAKHERSSNPKVSGSKTEKKWRAEVDEVAGPGIPLYVPMLLRGDQALAGRIAKVLGKKGRRS